MLLYVKPYNQVFRDVKGPFFLMSQNKKNVSKNKVQPKIHNSILSLKKL